MVNYVDKNGCFGTQATHYDMTNKWNESSFEFSFPIFALLYHVPSHLQVTYSHIGLFFWYSLSVLILGLVEFIDIWKHYN